VTIVDSHVHVYPSRKEGRRAKDSYEIWEYGTGGSPAFAVWTGDLEDAMSAMVEGGIDLAVVTNLLDPLPVASPADALLMFNEWLVATVARYPQFVPFLAVDPRVVPVAELVAHLHVMAARGAAGIKIHPPAQLLDPRDESVWPLFEACQDLGLRVIAHSGPSRTGSPLGEPDAFRGLLDAFPRLNLSLAHLGGAAWRQTVPLARDYPQVYFDCCEIIEWLGAERAPSHQEFVELIREVGVERVMMGSDFPWYDMRQTVRRVRNLPGLRAGEIAMILGENASRFLGLANGAGARS
jgi:hypothetical protein